MKKIINIAVLMVVFALAANKTMAQAKITDENIKDAKAKYQANKEKLNLTPEQSQKVDAINAAWFEGITELKSSNASKMTKYRKYKSLKSTRDQKMKETLTKDQYKTFQQQQKEMKDEFKERRANRE